MLSIQFFQIPVSLTGLSRQKVWGHPVLATDCIHCPEDRGDLFMELLGFFRSNTRLQLLAHQTGRTHESFDSDHLPSPADSCLNILAAGEPGTHRMPCRLHCIVVSYLAETRSVLEERLDRLRVESPPNMS
jgi:hypothetical protein